jgi:PAS domain S-box-containing protein
VNQSPASPGVLRRDHDYAVALRQVRWAVIIITLLTFPPTAPQALVVYAVMGLAIIYNLSHYVPELARLPVYSSRIPLLIADGLLFAAILYVIGAMGTPYIAFFVLLQILVTYCYGLEGLVVMLAGQMAVLVIISNFSLYPHLVFGPVRLVVTTTLVVFAIGMLVERLTGAERDERKALEDLSRENQEERDRLVALVDSLSDATFAVDAHGKVVEANGVAADLTGAEGSLKGKPIAELLPVNQGAHGRANFFEIMKSSSNPQRRRDLTLTGDGGEIKLEVAITPVKLGNRQAASYFVVCRDITEEKSLDEQREEFISVASHELRTPLSIMEVALSTALMSKQPLPPETVGLIEQAHRNVMFLSSVVKDLTTLSQAQNDTIPIALQPVSPHVILGELVKDFEPQVAAKGLAVKVVVVPDTPSVITTQQHVYEILQNYLSNAVKYTQAGEIIVKAEPGTTGGVIFSVQDNGIGISVGDQRKLFTKFYRSEDFRTRETGGTGLGLYLCLELAERMNAKVWCKSKLNHGSTFYLDVPPFSRLQRDHGEVVQAGVSSLMDQL